MKMSVMNLSNIFYTKLSTFSPNRKREHMHRLPPSVLDQSENRWWLQHITKCSIRGINHLHGDPSLSLLHLKPHVVYYCPVLAWAKSSADVLLVIVFFKYCNVISYLFENFHHTYCSIYILQKLINNSWSNNPILSKKLVTCIRLYTS
jgi:hypothetical protein